MAVRLRLRQKVKGTVIARARVRVGARATCPQCCLLTCGRSREPRPLARVLDTHSSPDFVALRESAWRPHSQLCIICVPCCHATGGACFGLGT